MTVARQSPVTPLHAAIPELVDIDPITAARWLRDHNTHNRVLSDADVRSYARDMAAGKWLMTGESIKFDHDGTLLDGQHRLAAIVKSKLTVPMLVIRGIELDAQAVMDAGRKRTAANALALRSEKYVAIMAAAARLGIGVEADLVDPGRVHATHSEVIDFIERHPEIRYACEFAQSVARKTDCPPSVVAYTFWRLSKLDTFAAAQFWVGAAEKVGLSKGDPVIALTNRFAEARRSRETLSKRIYLSLVYRAWNARRQGQTLRTLRVNSPAGGVVPIPEPK